MHLITPLMTGVRGAKNGTVFCYERGTTTPAPVYADASGKVRRYGALRLDALGSISLYVDRLVDVAVYDWHAALVREWTDGRADGAVVVESDAFTGVNYETGVSAVGERTTMAEVFARLIGSTGAVDWDVLYQAAAVPVYAAIGDVAGVLFDVRAFGARGDDIADDLGAIQAAIEAARTAGGGVVYLPAGTYKVSSTIALYEEVSLLGDGSNCTALVMTAATVPALAMFGSNDSTSQVVALTHTVSGITFRCEGVFSAEPLLYMVSGSGIVSGCYFDGGFNTGVLLQTGTPQRARISDCAFKVVAADSLAINTFVPGPGTLRAIVEGCVFYAYGTRTAGLVGISALHMEGCTFDMQNVTSGDADCIVLAGSVNGFVDGCEVTSISGGGSTTLLAASTLFDSYERLFEDCSLLDGATPFKLYRLVDNGGAALYYSRLKTVEARHAPLVEDLVAVNSGLNHPIIPDVSQYGIHSVYNKSLVAVAAPESSVVIGNASTSAYSNDMNGARPIDVLYFCVTQEGFNVSENLFRNSVVPRWNFKANSLFAFRLLHSRMPNATPITRLHTLMVAGGPASVNLAEREGYGPI